MEKSIKKQTTKKRFLSSTPQQVITGVVLGVILLTGLIVFMPKSKKESELPQTGENEQQEENKVGQVDQRIQKIKEDPISYEAEVDTYSVHEAEIVGKGENGDLSVELSQDQESKEVVLNDQNCVFTLRNYIRDDYYEIKNISKDDIRENDEIYVLNEENIGDQIGESFNEEGLNKVIVFRGNYSEDKDLIDLI